STVGVSAGSAIRPAQSHRCTWPVSVVTVTSQVSVATRWAGPAVSTGKSSVRYCPGGRSADARRRPEKPGEQTIAAHHLVVVATALHRRPPAPSATQVLP